MASEKEARSCFEELEEKCSSLEANLAAAEEESKKMRGQLITRSEELVSALDKVKAEKERAERAESKMPKGPDAETIRKMKVATVLPNYMFHGPFHS